MFAMTWSTWRSATSTSSSPGTWSGAIRAHCEGGSADSSLLHKPFWSLIAASKAQLLTDKSHFVACDQGGEAGSLSALGAACVPQQSIPPSGGAAQAKARVGCEGLYWPSTDPDPDQKSRCSCPKCCFTLWFRGSHTHHHTLQSPAVQSAV